MSENDSNPHFEPTSSKSRRTRSPEIAVGLEASWKTRLVNRKYVELARPLPFRELSALIEHNGRGYYFPLNSDDPQVASLKAHKIHQHLVREGWESTLNTFPREMTVAVFWIRSPLLSTYTTLFSLPNYNVVRRDTDPVSTTQCIRVLLIEPDPVSRRSLAHWLNQLPGYRCETTVGSLAEAIQLGASATFELILFNRVLHEASLENSLRQLAKVWVETPAFPFGVYASSDELFVGITGVGSGYFLRRRAPTQLLEPLGNPRPGHRWTVSKSETAARAYFLGLLSTTPQSEEASDVPLTHREREMLEFLSRGFQDKEIAAALGISVWTVHTHMKRTFEKLGVHNRAEAVSRYLQK